MKTKCNFKDHKSTERICTKCGYVIERTANDKIALNFEIAYTGEKPKCYN